MSSPIRAFVGLNGGGKTLAAVELVALRSFAEGRPVVSNFRIDHPLWRPLTSWRDIGGLRECALILDEINAAAPARSWGALPPELCRTLDQLRKVDVEVCWTAPDWGRADKNLRSVTRRVTTCRGMWADRWLRDERGRRVRDDNGRAMRYPYRWKPNRLFRWVTYSAEEFDEFTFSAARKLKPIDRQWYYRARHPAHRMYDTLESVALLDHLDFTGVCPICDGTRKRHTCKGHPELATVAHELVQVQA